ncbi:hypothetical protein BDN71DRAFT_1394229, partial [Pleurotus eryngii]
DLWRYELSPKHWKVIELVEQWLCNFHTTTVQMSATTWLMLSTTLAMFRGLQENLQDIITTLPTNTPMPLHDSLVSPHLKLSEYYTKIDESPYYTWASRTSSLIIGVTLIYL